MPEISIDEFEAANAAPPAPTPPPPVNEYKLDGDDVPPESRGRTAADVAAENERLRRALLISEQARLNPAPASAPAPAASAQLNIPHNDKTPEQWNEWFRENPVEAMAAWSDRTFAIADHHFNERLKPLRESGVSSAEQNARREYALEFELFGDQIERAAQSLPDKSHLTTQAGWDNLIAFVRGQKQNFNTYMKAVNKAPDPATAARTNQEISAGFNAAPSNAPSRAPSSVADLDPVTRQIAEELGMTPEEYIRYSKVNNGW